MQAAQGVCFLDRHGKICMSCILLLDFHNLSSLVTSSLDRALEQLELRIVVRFSPGFFEKGGGLGGGGQTGWAT